MNSVAPELSIVVPLHREAANVEPLVAVVCEHAETACASYELILVDDGSPDETWCAVCTEAERRNAVKGLRLSRNFGKEAALCAGLERARGKAVITMDGDFQHPPELIPVMLERWRRGEAEVIEAIKVSRGPERALKRLNVRGFYAIFGTLTGVDLHGATDFKLLDRKVVDEWLRLPERNLFFRGTVRWVGFSRVEVPFEVPERAGGAPSWSPLELLKLAFTAVTAFSSLPLQIATLVGGSFFFVAIALGIHTLYMKLSGRAVSGFATVILLELVIGSLVLLALGVIGQYIARIYDEVKARPRYVLAETAPGEDAEAPAS